MALDLSKPIRTIKDKMDAHVVRINPNGNVVIAWIAWQSITEHLWKIDEFARYVVESSFENIPETYRYIRWVNVYCGVNGTTRTGMIYPDQGSAITHRFDDWYATIKIDRELERGHVDED